MHNLQKCLRWAEKTLTSLNIPFEHPVEVTVNTRAKSRYGQCQKRPEGFKINISEVLVRDSSDIRALDETMLHELLHTCPGCQNHGKLWKYYAERVSQKTGLHITTTSDYHKKYGIPDERKKTARKAPVYRYIQYCPCCGQKWFYQRCTDGIRHPENYRCGKCKVPLKAGRLISQKDYETLRKLDTFLRCEPTVFRIGKPGDDSYIQSVSDDF